MYILEYLHILQNIVESIQNGEKPKNLEIMNVKKIRYNNDPEYREQLKEKHWNDTIVWKKQNRTHQLLFRNFFSSPSHSLQKKIRIKHVYNSRKNKTLCISIIQWILLKPPLWKKNYIYKRDYILKKPIQIRRNH